MCSWQKNPLRQQCDSERGRKNAQSDVTIAYWCHHCLLISIQEGDSYILFRFTSWKKYKISSCEITSISQIKIPNEMDLAKKNLPVIAAQICRTLLCENKRFWLPWTMAVADACREYRQSILILFMAHWISSANLMSDKVREQSICFAKNILWYRQIDAKLRSKWLIFFVPHFRQICWEISRWKQWKIVEKGIQIIIIGA